MIADANYYSYVSKWISLWKSYDYATCYCRLKLGRFPYLSFTSAAVWVSLETENIFLSFSYTIQFSKYDFFIGLFNHFYLLYISPFYYFIMSLFSTGDILLHTVIALIEYKKPLIHFGLDGQWSKSQWLLWA